MGAREERRAATEAEILRVGREHLHDRGAAALSLRAIARDLGMVSSGIYRYVESRDELLTRLIVQAYTSLGESVTSAHDAVAQDDLGARFDAIGRTLREWALANPQDFSLIYGSPVPDYSAPSERTTRAGTLVLNLWVRLIDDAHGSGRAAADPQRDQLAQGAVEGLLADDFLDEAPLTPAILARGLSAWTLVLGAVTSEVFSQLGPEVAGEPLFEWHLAAARGLVLAAG